MSLGILKEVRAVNSDEPSMCVTQRSNEWNLCLMINPEDLSPLPEISGRTARLWIWHWLLGKNTRLEILNLHMCTYIYIHIFQGLTPNSGPAAGYSVAGARGKQVQGQDERRVCCGCGCGCGCCLFVCLFVYLFVCWFARLFVCLFACLLACLLVCLLVSLVCLVCLVCWFVG